MLDAKGFNLWADNYDKSVNISDANDEYPFAGYKNIMNLIFNIVMLKPNSKVLDIGIGTGLLSHKLYENNHNITGIDFSKNMIEISKDKMPHAKLIKHNFTNSLPIDIQKEKFDFIIFTYSIHHLTDDNKLTLINSLKENLLDSGKMIIGDVSFQDAESLKACRNKFFDIWDFDEHYYTYDFLKDKLKYKNKEYHQISVCSGLLLLSN